MPRRSVYARDCERLALHVLSDYRMSREAREQEVASLAEQLLQAIAAYLDSLGLEPER